ncbi:MAG: NmrA/HSCARG family protein [Gemmatimonadetes bacterium]|nr:NmrA/HSCARG family protein [Gemmatimonadota bacterium]
MARDRVILVTGATGKQGGATIRELLAHRHTVRALTRKPESDAARALAVLGAEVVHGDLDDAASLRRALKGIWGVFAVQNTWEAGVEGEEEQGKRMAQLAREAGVEHFVYTSVGSAQHRTGIPHFDNKWRVEETVRGLGFPSHVVIRPVFFMDNFLSPWFKPGIVEGKLRMGIRPDTKLQMIAVADIGKVAHLAFDRHEELNGEAIDLAGDELTIPQAAGIIGQATGRIVAFERTPIEEIRKWSDDYATMLEWFDRVGYRVDIPALEARFGMQLTRFAQWAKSVSWS